MVNAYRKERGLPALNIIVGPLAETVELPCVRFLSDTSKTVTISTDPTISEEEAGFSEMVITPPQLEKTSSTSFREREFQEDSIRHSKLFYAWQTSVRAFSQLDPAARDEMTEKLWQRLCAAYNEPHRYYHNLKHIDELTAEFSSSIAALGPYQDECAITTHHQLVSHLILPLIYLVIFFHDVVRKLACLLFMHYSVS